MLSYCTYRLCKGLRKSGRIVPANSELKYTGLIQEAGVTYACLQVDIAIVSSISCLSALIIPTASVGALVGSFGIGFFALGSKILPLIIIARLLYTYYQDKVEYYKL